MSESTSTPALSPLEPAPAGLCTRSDVYLKREDTHELGSFKWRGALPALQKYRRNGATGVVTASTGNHGAATAWAAQRLGLSATVFGPESTSRTKLGLMEDLGATVIQTGVDLDEAKEAAVAYAAARTLPFFEDGDEPAQLPGYGEIGREIMRQLGQPPAAVLVPVGNGALISGVAGAIREQDESTRTVGVVPSAAPVMALSVQAGTPVPCEASATFADGLAVRVAIPSAVAALVQLALTTVLVSERELALAVRAYARSGIRVEGAGAAALAGLGHVDAEGPAVLLVTGRNIDESLYRRAVDRPEAFEG